MVSTNIYLKQFSKIGCLQKKETVYYNLLMDANENSASYGIEIISEVDDDFNREYIEDLSESKELACQVLRYLYENSVRAYCSNDILSDIFSNSNNFSKISLKT